MEESRSIPQTVQSSLETPNRVIVLVETFTGGSTYTGSSGMGVFMKATLSITEQNGEVFRQSHR